MQQPRSAIDAAGALSSGRRYDLNIPMDQNAEHPRNNGHAATFERLEQFAKASAVAVTALYVVGFLIVNVHHARFGIAFTEILRPRVLAAGVTFALLIAMGWFIADGVQQNLRRHGRLTTFFETAFNTAVWCSMAMFVLAPWLLASVDLDRTLDRITTDWNWLRWLVALVIAFLISAKFPTRPSPRWLWLPLGATAVALIFSATAVWWGAEVTLLAIWLWGCGVTRLVPRDLWSMLRSPGPELSYQMPVLVLSLLSVYARGLYANLKPEWGGGAPVSATVEIHDNDRVRVEAVRVLEETQHGFYLLSEDGIGTLFIARTNVRSILFRPRNPNSTNAARPAQ